MRKHISLLMTLLFVWMTLLSISRFTMLENFDGEFEIESIEEYDMQPDSLQISPNGYEDNCLNLFGNIGKRIIIEPYLIEDNTVFKFTVKSTGPSNLIAIGVSDSINSLRYSIYGNLEHNIEEFVTCYQESKEDNEWVDFLLPIADDWQAWYDYLPEITGLEFITITADSIFFDSVQDLTDEINQAPQCSFTYRQMGTKIIDKHTREITYQFRGEVSDPEGDIINEFHWNFGDGIVETSEFSRVNHTYTVTDDHPYSVLFEVADSQGEIGRFVEHVDIEMGDSTLPVKLNFVGDVMFARRLTSTNIPEIFSEVDSVLGLSADITVANLETPLADTGTMHPTKSVAFRSSPTSVVALENGGVDLVSLANNHSWDYMTPALQQTMDVLDDSDILHCGAGINSIEAYKPAYVFQKGMILAFLGSCDRTGQYNNAKPYLNAGYDKAGFAYMTPYFLTEQIESVEGIADLNVVMMHGGSEYSYDPGSDYDKFIDRDADEDFNPRMDIPHMWDIEIRHHAIDSGADLVIVHHPHIVQGIEVYNGKVIAHSLGNFVFDLNYPECLPSMILNTEADMDGFKNFTVTPIYIDSYKPKVVYGELGTHLLRYISMKSRELNTIVHVNSETNRAEVILDSLDYNFPIENEQLNVPMTQYDENDFLSNAIDLTGVIKSVNEITGGDSIKWRLGRESFPMGNMEFEGVSYWSTLPEETTEYRSGATSHSLVQPETERTMSQKIQVKDGDKTLTGYIKAIDCSAQLEVEFYTNYNSYYPNSTYSTGLIVNTNEWTKVSIDIPHENDQNYFKISLVRSGDNADSEAYFDDVHLVVWGDWQIEQQTQVPFPNDYYWLQLASYSTPTNELALNYSMCDITYHDPVGNSDGYPVYVTGLCNYPNPFNPETTIQFTVKEKREKAELSIYNIRGQKVTGLFKGDLEQGQHRFKWYGEDKNGNHCASGIYFYRLKHGSQSTVGKMVLLK